MLLPNFKDPSVIFRAIIVGLSALSVILLIAGTAVDEYFEAGSGSVAGIVVGCQKAKMPATGFSYRAGFKDVPSAGKEESYQVMNTLSLVILIFTSLLCALQAAAAALNGLVLLLGFNAKPALISSSVLTVLLFAVIVMANVNFTGRSAMMQFENITKSKGYEEAGLKYAADQFGGAAKRVMSGDFSDMSRGRSADMGGFRMKRRSGLGMGIGAPTGEPYMAWGASYGLLCAAFAFAVINQILLISIHLMSKSGVTTFGALTSSVVSFVRDWKALLRLGTTFLSALMLFLMVLGTALDRYVMAGFGCGFGTRLFESERGGSINLPFKEMYMLSIVLFALTIVICLLQAASVALNVLQFVKKQLPLIFPLVAVSGLSTVLLLASIVVACLNFTKNRYAITSQSSWGVSFNCIGASFAFAIINTALNALCLVLAKRGGGLSRPSSGTLPSATGMPSTGAASTASNEANAQPAPPIPAAGDAPPQQPPIPN